MSDSAPPLSCFGLQPKQEDSPRRVHPTNAYLEFPQTEVEQSIAQRFEKQVVQHRHRLAVRTAQHHLTYDALNRLANRLARTITRTTRPDAQAVALLLDHDVFLIAAILAVLKSGNFYVALDPSHPPDRIRNILEDSQAGLLITDPKHLSLTQDLVPEKCSLLNLGALDPDLSDENLERKVPPSTLAYIIYTSGSTGKPKGVCQTQRNVLHHTRKYTSACHLCAADRFSLLARCSFAASVSNLFGALLNGGALLPFKVREEGAANLRDWLREEEISIYHSVPLLFRDVANTVTDQKGFPKLRLIKLGGEAITRTTLNCSNSISPSSVFCM